MNRAFARLGAAALLLGGFAHTASADTITSQNFSLGYSFNRTGNGTGAWNLQSPSDPTTQGQFTFNPVIAATATAATNAGPTFGDRILTDGTGSTGASARAYQFEITITGAYLGTLPEAAINPTITLNITQISIYGVRTSSNANNMAFEETTSGHQSTSAATTLKSAGFSGGGTPSGALVTNWTHMAWDPGDFSFAGLSPASRSFELGYFDSLGAFAGSTLTDNTTYFVDGFEVFGNVTVSYTVPEPAALSVLGVGAMLILRRRTRS